MSNDQDNQDQNQDQENIFKGGTVTIAGCGCENPHLLAQLQEAMETTPNKNGVGIG